MEMSKKTFTYDTRILNDREFNFPSFMCVLSQQQINEFLESSDNLLRIFGAGVDPKDNSLIFITMKGEVLSITPNGKLVPKAAIPSVDGRHLCVAFPGESGFKLIEADHAVKEGKDLFQGGELYVKGRKFLDI